MLQQIELFILELVRGLFTAPAPITLGLFGSAAVVLLIAQFANRNRTVVPGIFGLFFVVLSLLYLLLQSSVVRVISNWRASFATPSAGVRELGFLEPLFEIFVAPAASRSLLEEVLFVGFVVYLGLVVRISIQEYRKTGKILGELSFSGLIGVASRVARPKRSTSNELGSADLASSEQIHRWTKPPRPGDTTLYVNDLRGSDGIALKSGKLVIPREERNKHILFIAKTGGGKTTKAILPILYGDCLDPERSTIVIDSKPEMWRILAAMTRKYNPQKRIMLFNPLDTARSMGWNILSKIEDDTDCKLIANTIIMATDNPSAKQDSPFFRNNALAVLNAIMVGLLSDPNEVLSMPRVHQLVQSGMRPLCDWLEAHPEAIRNTRTFVELARSGSQNADTIMSELSMRLSAWDLQAIRATTSSSEIDLEDIIQHPTLFIVEFRESELEMLRPMANVIVVELLRFLTKRAESFAKPTLPRPVGLVIDEFASALGRLPDIHVKLNTLRSRNVSIVGAIQSIAQVKANYGDDADSVLAGFSSKFFIPNLDIQDAEFASKETGQMTIRFKTASSGSNRKITEVFASKNDGTQEQVQQRAVLTPDEIGRPTDNICTIFLPNTPVFQGHLIPSYRIPEVGKRLEEFNRAEHDLKVRSSPIEYRDGPSVSTAIPAAATMTPGAVTNNGLPPGISDTRGWSDDQLRKHLEEIKSSTLDWENTTGSARKWWEAFENENLTRLALVVRLAEELQTRRATITEFFLAYVYSNTDNIQANLFYLDYVRLKKEDEERRRIEEEQKVA